MGEHKLAYLTCFTYLLTQYLQNDQYVQSYGLQVQFWSRSGSPFGSRSLKSEISSLFTGLSKKLPTDFDEILWRAEVWPRDQLITFW